MLSVCLIAKNEERHLARCLTSVRGLAGEIILVDTGSSRPIDSLLGRHRGTGWAEFTVDHGKTR